MRNTISLGFEYSKMVPCPSCTKPGELRGVGYTQGANGAVMCKPCSRSGLIGRALDVKDAGNVRHDQAPHVILLIDNSSSMVNLTEAVPKAVNAFVEAQREYSGSCDISVFLFGSTLRCVYDSVSLSQVPQFKNYNPHEGTRLRAAVAHILAQQMSRPALVCAFSDGSDGLSVANYEALMHEAHKKGWMFTYVGIGYGAAEADAVGFPKEHSVMVEAHSDGLQKAVKALSRAAVLYRDGESDFSKAMQQAQEEQTNS